MYNKCNNEHYDIDISDKLIFCKDKSTGCNFKKNRSAMRTWGLMLKFIPFGWNAVLTYQCLEAELLQAKR